MLSDLPKDIRAEVSVSPAARLFQATSTELMSCMSTTTLVHRCQYSYSYVYTNPISVCICVQLFNY